MKICFTNKRTDLSPSNFKQVLSYHCLYHFTHTNRVNTINKSRFYKQFNSMETLDIPQNDIQDINLTWFIIFADENLFFSQKWDYHKILVEYLVGNTDKPILSNPISD